MSVLAERLAAADDDRVLDAFGFHEDDRADVHRVIRLALSDPERLAEIESLAERMSAAVGDPELASSAFDTPAGRSEWEGVGVQPMLALIAMAEDVRAFHRSRGVPTEISERSLSDLGQQAWVHRRTFGAFGLHTYGWMTIAYSGNLYWLGRLQFNLAPRGDGWQVSTHIPETGPLTPDAVQDSFRQAAAFFAEHFADHPASVFHCGSWLLDPQLVEVLRPESNMVHFQRLWHLEGEPREADDDAIFFVFRRRGDVDRSTLPRDTTLQRAILDKLDAGGHWYFWSGTIDQAPYLAEPATATEPVTATEPAGVAAHAMSDGYQGRERE